jgi:hypothetical protein
LQQTLYKWNPTAAAPTVEVWTGDEGTKLDFSGLTLDYEHDFQLDPSDAGDDDKLQPAQYLDQLEQLMLVPGTSISIALPEGQADYTFKILLEEEHVQPIAHISSAALPASGAYTTATYFDIPEEWTALTFLVTYTAAGGSTNARPKTRVSWSDGTNSFIQPIVSTSLDVSAFPVARRDQYELEQRWPTAVSASSTVRFAVAIERMPGIKKVRLDVAELGDTANPGTIVVSVTGGGG